MSRLDDLMARYQALLAKTDGNPKPATPPEPPGSIPALRELWGRVLKFKGLRLNTPELRDAYRTELERFLKKDQEMGQPREFEEARKTAQAELKRMDEIKKARQTEMDNLPEAKKKALEDNLQRAEANAKGKRLRLTIKLTPTGYCWKVEHLGLSNPGQITLVIETVNEEGKGQETASHSITITQIEKGSKSASILASSAVAKLSPKPEDNEALARKTRKKWMAEGCVDKMEALPLAEIKDLLSIDESDACGNILKASVKRVLLLSPNPNGRAVNGFSYKDIVALGQIGGTEVGRIPDATDMQPKLPATAAEALSPKDFESLRHHLQANKALTSPLELLIHRFSLDLPALPPPRLYQVIDSPPVAQFDAAGNVTGYTATRTISLVPNPNCLPTGFTTVSLLGNSATTTNAPQVVLTATAAPLNLSNVRITRGQPITLAEVQAFFDANPSRTSLSYPLTWNLPPAMFARGPVSIPIQVGYWNAVVNPASLATPAVRDLINWLRANPSNTITIIGWFNNSSGGLNPLTNGYTPTERATNGIPSAVINRIDYIFVKANNVRDILISMGAPAAQINVPTSLTPAQMMARIVIGNPALASSVEITIP